MEIKLYTLSTCPYCEKTMDFLKANEVEFEPIVIDRLAGKDQEDAIAEAYRLSGQRNYPVTDVDGTGVIGLDVVRFKKLLNIEGEKTKKSFDEAAGHEKAGYSVDGEKLDKIRNDALKTGYILNPDEEIVKALVSGLLRNESRYGYRSCPCRLSAGDYNKDSDIICPCAYRDPDLDEYGRCYCGLYVTEDFAGSGANMKSIPERRKYQEPAAYKVTPEMKKEEGIGSCEILAGSFIPEVREVIKIFAYTLGRNGRDGLKEDFQEIAKALNIGNIAWHGETAEGRRATADGGSLRLRFLQGMDGYVYVMRVVPGSSGKVSGDTFAVCTDFLRKNRTNELYQLDIFIADRTVDFLAGEIKAQRLNDGILLFSGYDSRDKLRRYVAMPGSESDLDKLIDDLVRLETCYNILLTQRQKYLLIADQLNALEERIATKMGVINLNISKADGEVLKGWLHWLSMNFSEISGITEELKRHAADTEARRNLLSSILERWNGIVEGYQSISEPLRFYTRGIGDDYGRLAQRVDGIRREMGDVITILRTKVDLIQQEQSLDIQKSMHETAKTQLKMQKAVESLEVFIVTYYLTSLAKITFEALEAQGRHLPDKPIILAGYLIPVFFIFSIFLSGKIWHLVDRLRKRFGGKGHE